MGVHLAVTKNGAEIAAVETQTEDDFMYFRDSVCIALEGNDFGGADLRLRIVAVDPLQDHRGSIGHRRRKMNLALDPGDLRDNERQPPTNTVRGSKSFIAEHEQNDFV